MSFPPHEVYSKCLLEAHVGYPLWTPQLKTQLCESYQLEGLKIGDVGIITPKNGGFDVLFNITLPRDEQPYPELVREGFIPVPLDRQRDLDTQPNAVSPTQGLFPCASVQLVSARVHNCDQVPSKADYEFSLSMGDGAILVLPEGAESCDLHNEKTFLGEAIRHGVDWYECATEKAGRLISNDSLYLITGFHKARSWSLGATNQSRFGVQTPRSLTFEVGQTHKNCITARAYRWAVVQGFMGRVGPETPYEIPNCITNERRRGVNQTVFIRGFRIMVNKILFLKTVYVETPQGTFGGLGTYINNLLWGAPSESTQSSSTYNATDNTVEQDYSVQHSRLYTDGRMSIDRVPDVFQTFHPGDLINRYMLKQEPHAKVALTHDSLWIEMLQMGLLKLADFSHEEHLEEVLAQNYRIIAEDGAVYLQEKHVLKRPPHKHHRSTSPSSIDRTQKPGASDPCIEYPEQQATEGSSASFDVVYNDSGADKFSGSSNEVLGDFPNERLNFVASRERLPISDPSAATETDDPYDVRTHFSESMEDEFRGIGIRVMDHDKLREPDAVAPILTSETATLSSCDHVLSIEESRKQNQESTTKPILCNVHGIMCRKAICAEYATQLRLSKRAEEAEESKAAGASEGGHSGKDEGGEIEDGPSGKNTASSSFGGPGMPPSVNWHRARSNIVSSKRIEKPGATMNDEWGNSDSDVKRDVAATVMSIGPADITSDASRGVPDPATKANSSGILQASLAKHVVSDQIHESSHSLKDKANSALTTYGSSIGQEDIVIAVMGLTGAGKSSFVNMAAGRTEVVVGKLKSETRAVQTTRCLHPDGRRNIVLVDTPGFDDTNLSDAQILRIIAGWLKGTYQNKIKLSGLLYLHRISDVKMAGTPLRNLSVFKDLCGDDSMKNIILVTTMWDKTEDQSIGFQREEELLSEFWKDMIRLGSRTCRFRGTRESAWEIINLLDLEGAGRKRIPLKIQVEMVDRGLQLHETTAAKTFVHFLIRLAKEAKKSWVKLRCKLRCKLRWKTAPRQPRIGIRPSSPESSSSVVSSTGLSRSPRDSTPLSSPTESALSVCSTNRRQDILAATIKILGLAHQMADIAHIPLLRGIIGTALSTAKIIQETGGMHHAIIQVIEGSGWLLHEVTEYAIRSELSKDMNRALVCFQRELNNLQKVVTKIASRGRIARFRLYDTDIKTITACSASIKTVYDKLEIKLAMENREAIAQLKSRLVTLWEGTILRECECGSWTATHEGLEEDE